MSMHKKKVNRGDVVEIKGIDDVIYYAQVTWVSDYYKDVIQIYFLKSYDPSLTLDKLEYREPPYFTSAKIVRTGQWPKIAEEACNLLPSPPIYYSAGDMWQGDTMLRKASESEMKNALRLRVMGKRLIEKYVAIT